MSTIKDEYRKERNRLKRLIASAEKRGYIVPENLLPKQPKRITRASVNRLAKIRASDLYSKSYWVDPTTGEYLTGVEGRTIEKQRESQKARITRILKAEKQRIRQQIKPEKQSSKEVIKSGDYPSEAILGYNRLLSIIHRAHPSANANIMMYHIRDFVSREGEEALVRVFNTFEGRLYVTRAADIAYDSDGERAKSWWAGVESLLVKNYIMTPEQVKELQDNRAQGEWEDEIYRFERREKKKATEEAKRKNDRGNED